MSPHGDLVEFGYILAGPILVMALAYLWGRYIAFREQRRHNLAVERHNYRIWQQIKRLGDCPDGCEGEEKPYVPVRSLAEARNAMIRGGRS